jgi:hypothetical protein
MTLYAALRKTGLIPKLQAFAHETRSNADVVAWCKAQPELADCTYPKDIRRIRWTLQCSCRLGFNIRSNIPGIKKPLAMPAEFKRFAGPYDQNSSAALTDHAFSLITARQFTMDQILIVKGEKKLRYIAVRVDAIKGPRVASSDQVKDNGSRIFVARPGIRARKGVAA